jgi:hypothetical protein
VTRNFLPSTRTGKKQVTATQTAPNQTAGPLYVRFRHNILDTQHTSKSLAAHPYNFPFAAKHMLFANQDPLVASCKYPAEQSQPISRISSLIYLKTEGPRAEFGLE